MKQRQCCMRKRISITATLKFRWNQGNEKRRLLFGRYYIIQRGITGEFNFFYLRVRECQEMQSGEEYAKSSIEMADGQAGCIDTKEYYDDRKNFWLRLYLDKTKKNYVEFFSDQHGFGTDYMVDHNGFRADFLDNGEQAYCYDWRGQEKAGLTGARIRNSGSINMVLNYRRPERIFRWKKRKRICLRLRRKL